MKRIRFSFEEEVFGWNPHNEFFQKVALEEKLKQIPDKLISLIGEKYLKLLQNIKDFNIKFEDLDYWIKRLGKLAKITLPEIEVLNKIIIPTGDSYILDSFQKRPFSLIYDGYGSSTYAPKTNILTIGIFPYLRDFLMAWKHNFETITFERCLEVSYPGNSSDKKMFRQYLNEFSARRMRMSIAHELTHWLDEVENLSISKGLTWFKKSKPGKPLNMQKIGDVNFHSLEIEAQVNSIAELKKEYTEKEWQEFSFEDLCYLYPSLMAVINTVVKKGKPDLLIQLEEWLKKLTLRLYREKLLGKKMDYSLLMKSLFNLFYP